MFSFFKRHIKKNNDVVIVNNNTVNIGVLINVNIGFGGCEGYKLQREYYDQYSEDIYKPVWNDWIDFDKRIHELDIAKDIEKLKEIYIEINSYFDEVNKNGVRLGYLSEALMSWDELEKFKVGKQYMDFAVFHHKRQIGKFQSKLLRKIARYFLKNDLLFAKEVFEKIFELKQELKSDIRSLEELNKKHLLT